MLTCSRISKELEKSEEGSPSTVNGCHFGSNDLYTSPHSCQEHRRLCGVFAIEVPLGGTNGAVWSGHET